MNLKLAPRHMVRLGAVSTAIVVALALTAAFSAAGPPAEESPYPPTIRR